ncbi:hypothetical protein ACFLYO_10150 [Chloroflexota bacterium]
MAQTKQLTDNLLWSLLFRLLSSDWAAIILRSWDLLKHIHIERVGGLYEVLDFDHTLELCDPHGKKAIYHKREKVRLLQDHVASYVDHAWGKGDIFANYHCSPGIPVDRYRRGHMHCVLISLREAKRRGDMMNIRIDHTVHNGFSVTTGWSETTVQHRTHRFRIAVIFPSERLPKKVFLLQANLNRTILLHGTNTELLSDGRYKVFWQTDKPRLFETYTLKWTW